MLKVQEYLKKYSLIKLQQEFFIDCRVCPDLDIVVLDYQLFSPDEEEIVRECRCLILEMNTWNIVCKSMSRFYYIDEDYSSIDYNRIDWNSAKSTIKYDGALIVLYYYKNAWRIGMRKSADGSMITTAINGVPSDYTFAELTQLTIKEMGYTWDQFTSNLNTNIFYSFELCAPETRFGVIYTNRQLIQIAAIDKNTLNEIDIYSLECPILKAEYSLVNSLQEAQDSMKEQTATEQEGVVILDKNFRRIKVRNPNYSIMMAYGTPDNELLAIENIIHMFNTGTTPVNTVTGGTAS